MSDYDWRATTMHDALRDVERLIIYRRTPQGTEVLCADVVVKTIADHAQVDEPVGLELPRDALTAIAEHVKPGPSHGEMMRLEEALGVERARVDMLLLDLRRIAAKAPQ